MTAAISGMVFEYRAPAVLPSWAHIHLPLPSRPSLVQLAAPQVALSLLSSFITTTQDVKILRKRMYSSFRSCVCSFVAAPRKCQEHAGSPPARSVNPAAKLCFR